MKLQRGIIALAFLWVGLVGVSFAQTPPAVTDPSTMPVAGTLPVPPAVTPAPTVVIPSISPVPATPAVTQNTVTTTGPVKSETTISVGTLAGQILNWIMVAFGPVIGSMVVWILVRVLNKLGIQATDALRARLYDITINGMNSGASQIETNMAGRDPIDIKNAVVASAVAYTQAHAADTIKALGLDPQSGAAVEAIKAKIQTAINDPSVATPPVLGGQPKVV